MEKWFGKTAIVTGASAGIGEAIVKDFAKHGINVIALARRMEKLEALQEELKEAKGKVIAMRCDVSMKSSIDSTFEEIEKPVTKYPFGRSGYLSAFLVPISVFVTN